MRIAGSGAAKVAASRSCGLSPGEDTPKAPRAFADPLRLPALAYGDDATHSLHALSKEHQGKRVASPGGASLSFSPPRYFLISSFTVMPDGIIGSTCSW